MDDSKLEPGHWVRPDLAGVRALLRQDVCGALAWGARASVRAGVRPSTVARTPGTAAPVAQAQAHLRQLDERPLPRGHPGRDGRTDLRRHAPRRPSRLPSPNKAPRAPSQTCPFAPV